MLLGRISWFSSSKGYGYIELPDGRAIYVAHSDMENQGQGFRVGDEVVCEVVQGSRGLKAIKVAKRYQHSVLDENLSITNIEKYSEEIVMNQDKDMISRNNVPGSKISTINSSNKRRIKGKQDKSTKPNILEITDADEAYGRALVARQDRRYDQARELFDQAIRLSSKRHYFDAYARMEKDLRRFDRARNILQLAIQRIPQDGMLYENLGELERSLKNLKQAANIFRQGLQRVPRHKVLHRCLAQVLVDMNDPNLYNEAEKHFQIAREHGLMAGNDQRYLKLKVLNTHKRGMTAWRFLRAAGFEETFFWLHTDEQYAADIVFKPLKPEYVEAYDLTDEVFIRCFYKDIVTYEDIRRASTRLRHADIHRQINRDVIFVVLASAAHLRDALYRQLEEPDKPAVVPLEEIEMQQALQADDCEAILRQKLDQWLYRRDLYKGNFPVAGRRFFGREVELATLMHNIEGGQHTGIFGLRKVGKTSILYQLREKRTQDIAAYIDLQAAPPGVKSCSYIYWNSANQWRKELTDKYPELAKSIRFRLGGVYESYAELPSQESVAIALDADIRSIYRALRTKIDKEQIKSLLLLDELERMLPNPINKQGWSGYADFFAYIRGFAQETGFLISVIAAANPSIREEAQLEGQDNPVFQFYGEVYLPPLKPNECYEMVEKIGQGMGLSYEQPSLELIYKETGGHPFITRQLCSHLSTLFPHRPLRVEESHVKSAIEEFLFRDDSLNKEILSRLEESFPHEKEILVLIAQGVNDSTDLAKYSTGDLEESLRHLIGYQLIERKGISYYVKIGLLNRWIRRRWLNLED